MKINPIFVGLLVIFITNTQVRSQVIVTLLAIKEVIDCCKALYIFMDKIFDQTPKKVMEILGHVNDMSNQIDSMDSKMDVKLDGMLNVLIADIGITVGVELMKIELCENIDKIDSLFDKSRLYKFGTECGNRTLKQFIHAALWSQHSLPNLLNGIIDLFTPGIQNKGLLTLMYEREMLHLDRKCDEYSSPQQQMYYTYIQLIVTEIKSLVTLEQVYLTKQIFDETGHVYKGEIKFVQEQLEKRLWKYYDIFSKIIASVPRMIRRCDVNIPEYGVNYIEMGRFSRLSFVTEQLPSGCPNQARLNLIAQSRQSKINKCIALGKSLKTCPADSDSSREYEWWTDETSGIHYGPDTPCEHPSVVKGITFTAGGITGTGSICACSVDQNNSNMKISVTEQYSNINENMVVTGIKFVMINNTLHLQIQQANFSHDGLMQNGSVWKDLDSFQYDKQEVKKLSYQPLSPDRKTIYLDDIEVPKDYVVTGVAFRAIDNAFMMNLHATRYNFTSGKLVPSDVMWVNGESHPMKSEDYSRSREIVNMTKPDDPKRGSQFTYDLKSNKQVTFTHTDIEKDAGQTTIPLLDAQPVVTNPPFPLNGIGLSFRGRYGYAGYIALRIFTFDISDYVKKLGVKDIREENKLV